MRVLAVTNMYPVPGMPSFGTFIRNQVESVMREGVEVDVLFINGRKNAINYVWGFFRLWARLLTRRYDLIHAHYVFCGIIARAQFLHPVVLTHHGPQVFMTWQAPVCRVVTNFMDRVIVRTQEMKDRMACPRAEVMPAGGDFGLFRPVPQAEARRLLDLPPDAKLVLWAGERFRKVKRLELVEQAVALLQQRVPQAQLVVVSGQPQETVPLYM